MKFVVTIFYFVVVAVTSSCSTTTTNENEKLIETTIEITHKRESDSWKVKYSFSRPVLRAQFVRQRNKFRRDIWKILTPGVFLNEEDDFEVFTSETPFKEVTIEHKSYYKYTPKDYEFFFNYSSQNVLMYSGHYDLFPIEASRLSVSSEQLKRSETKFILLPDKKEHIVILGKVYRQRRIEWVDKAKRGTYIYWGDSIPVEDDHVVAIVDESVPQWLRDETKKYLPRLFSYYFEKTGAKLNFRPVVFFNAQINNDEKLGTGGGTLPGLVQLTVRGSEWPKRSNDSFQKLFQFLAHESAHLWNAQMYDSDSSGHSWMHEGGADAFAFQAMLDFRVINNNKLKQIYNNALNRCILELDNYPLMKSADRRDYKNYYTCGSIVSLVSSKIIGAENVFGFWKKLFTSAESKERKYSDEDYFSTLFENSKNINTIELLKKLVYGSFDDRSKLLEKILKSSGIGVQSTLVPGDSSLDSLIARDLVRNFYRNDCGGSTNISRREKSVILHGNQTKCNILKKDIEVTHIEETPIFGKVSKLYKNTKGACITKGKVKLTIKGKKEMTALSCPTKLFILPSFLELKSI